MSQDAEMLVATLPDGSSVRYVREDGRCSGDPGEAQVLAAFLAHVVDQPSVEAARWVEGDASAGELAVRRMPGNLLAIEAGGERLMLQRDAVIAALDGVLGERLESEPFWLFQPTPIACRPAPHERELLAPVERRAGDFYQAVEAGALDAPTESARRQLLLADFAVLGLLDEPLLLDKLFWLRTWGMPALASVAAAARDLWSYFRSAPRRLQVGEPPPEQIRGARVSLDWTRAPAPVPAGWGPHEWLAVCERMLVKLPPAPAAARGRLFVAQGPVLAEVFWRREDGEHPAIYGAHVGRRG
ncbi:MAG TPA: hypothetical protein VL242_36645 [Sorangium sp.]|nr:hypothetical protein [Sorangium sp.]